MICCVFKFAELKKKIVKPENVRFENNNESIEQSMTFVKDLLFLITTFLTTNFGFFQ